MLGKFGGRVGVSINKTQSHSSTSIYSVNFSELLSTTDKSLLQTLKKTNYIKHIFVSFYISHLYCMFNMVHSIVPYANDI